MSCVGNIGCLVPISVRVCPHSPAVTQFLRRSLSTASDPSNSSSPPPPHTHRFSGYWTEDRRKALKLMNYSWPVLVLSGVLLWKYYQNPYDQQGGLKRPIEKEKQQDIEKLVIRTPK